MKFELSEFKKSFFELYYNLVAGQLMPYYKKMPVYLVYIHLVSFWASLNFFALLQN